MREWFRKFFAVDNTVSENTVMGTVAFTLSVGFGIVAIFESSSLIPMGSFLGFSATCFGLNWKYK